MSSTELVFLLLFPSSGFSPILIFKPYSLPFDIAKIQWEPKPTAFIYWYSFSETLFFQILHTSQLSIHRLDIITIAYCPSDIYIKAIAFVILNILIYVFMPMLKVMAAMQLTNMLQRSTLCSQDVVTVSERLVIRLDPFAWGTR